MANTFDVGEMRSALPGQAVSRSEASPGNTTNENGANTADPAWGERLPYNYTELSRQGPAAPFGDWECDAAVYEFDYSQLGEVGPEHPGLEAELFGTPEERGLKLTGIAYETLDTIEVNQRGTTRIAPIKAFHEAGLHPVMLRNVDMAGYRNPTPIQRYSFPIIQKGLDLVAIAQTGSGKTASYLVPILNKLMGKAKQLAAPRPNPAGHMDGTVPAIRAEPLVVIVCPSRELAVQIFNEARKFCYRTMLRPCVAYGGGPINHQITQLGKGCDVLIATPGRLCDFIKRPGVLTLRRLRYMVIDEADEMLQDDWQEELDLIMAGGEQDDGNVNFMLFSATFPKNLRDLARQHLANSHIQINVGRIGSTHGNILQQVIEVQHQDKKALLRSKIEELGPSRTIIFVNSKRTADELDDFLFNAGYPSSSMHSDRTQLEREAAMRAFRRGTCPLLVATGLTARGIDVRNVKHIINYDLPSIDYGGIEEYTHRIGRTGRIGHKGIATSFYNPDRDEAIASVLVRTLLETNQEVPDFLQSYMPEGDDLRNLKWETDSDEANRPKDNCGGDAGAGGGWGGASADNQAEGGAGGWGGAGDASGGDAGGWGTTDTPTGGGDNGWGTAPSADAWGAAPAGEAGMGWNA